MSSWLGEMNAMNEKMLDRTHIGFIEQYSYVGVSTMIAETIRSKIPTYLKGVNLEYDNQLFFYLYRIFGDIEGYILSIFNIEWDLNEETRLYEYETFI